MVVQGEDAFVESLVVTIAVDAEFIIDEAAIVVRCSACDTETPARANRLVCGECGDFRTTVVSG